MRTVLRLEDGGISAARYRELEYFCLQYGEKRARLAQLAGAMGGGLGGDERVRGGLPGDPTARAVALRELLLRDCEDIEAAAMQAAGKAGEVMAKWLLRYVTSTVKPPIDMAPCGRRYFYAMRRRFFYVLHGRRAG